MKDELIVDSFRVMALTALQVGVFVVLHDAAVETYVSHIVPMRGPGVSFGIALQIGIYLMSVLACLNSVAQVFAQRLVIRFIVAATAVAVWGFYWLNLTDVFPYRVAMLSAVGAISFATGVLFMLPKIDVRVELR